MAKSPAPGSAGKWVPPEQMPGAVHRTSDRPAAAGPAGPAAGSPVRAAAAVATVTRPESPATRGGTTGGGRISDGKSAERRLAFWLVAPAAALMALVTGYPIIYAFWLSLNKESLSAPGERSFVGLSNYVTVLSDGYWWTAFGVTMFITVVSVAIELVLGMAVALVMHRTIFGKGVIRTVVLIPYGIVTVAAAFSWYYAWTPGTGYLANLLPDGSAPLTSQWPSLFIIILAEVWKTTPFMALLLLAGLALVPDDLLQSGPGRRCRCLDETHAHHHSADETGDPHRTAVPHARRVPRVRQHLRAHQGSNNTYSVSMLGYDNLFKAFNLGVGSAISILIFLCVAIIAFVFVRGFTAAPGSDNEGR